MEYLQSLNEKGFLHVCGDVSVDDKGYYTGYKFSPRMWRCFYLFCSAASDDSVFSTYVEMFLLPLISIMNRWGFLHVCGDVSYA